MNTQDVIDALNRLIETCRDGEYGFLSSAEHVASPLLRTLFADRAAECRRAARDLQAAINAMGAEPSDGGSAAGAMHRGWVAVKGALAGFSDVTMLEECERGEDAAIERYRKALEVDLPADIRTLVQHQYEGAQRTHDEIRRLREEARATS
jgi:uncharacterized protein (TIGR02284 family)